MISIKGNGGDGKELGVLIGFRRKAEVGLPGEREGLIISMPLLGCYDLG